MPATALAVATGAVVRHQTFGLGDVIATSGSGESSTATVNFYRPDVGQKRLILRYAPLDVIRPPHMPESEAVAHWRTILEPHFWIEEEVPGKHWTGKRVRIDMLLHPRGWDWRGGGRQPIGFEVKSPYGDIAQMTRHIGQAVDYAQTAWTSEAATMTSPYVYVFIHNRLSDVEWSSRAALNERNFWVPRFIGRLGVGLVDFDDGYHGVSLSLSGNRVWTSKAGPCNVNWPAIRRFGSR